MQLEGTHIIYNIYIRTAEILLTSLLEHKRVHTFFQLY